MATGALKTYTFCQKIQLFFISSISQGPTNVLLLYHVQFFCKCCCNAVLQVDLWLKICSPQCTDTFLKYSNKFPEQRRVFLLLLLQSLCKGNTLPNFSTPPDTCPHLHHHSHHSTTILTKIISPKQFLCPEHQLSLKHYRFQFIKKEPAFLKQSQGDQGSDQNLLCPVSHWGSGDSSPRASFEKCKCTCQSNKFRFLLTEGLSFFFPEDLKGPAVPSDKT